MEAGNKSDIGQAPVFSVKDDLLENNAGGTLHLSMQRGEGVFSWALLNTDQNKFLALESLLYSKENEAGLSEALKKETWFSYVSSFSLSCISDGVTLVPEPLYNETEKERYVQFNLDTDKPGSVILSSKLRTAGCRAVYIVPGEVVKLYANFFPGIKLIHTGTETIESILSEGKNETTEKVSLHIRRKSIELVITWGSALLFYNTFSYTAKEDVIYYLLFTLEQMKLNPESIPLQLFGGIDKNDPLYSLIHKYVRDVSFGERSKRFDYSYRFNEFPAHTFNSIFNQHLCV